MTSATAPGLVKTASLFLSWSHRDRALKDDLVARLTDELGMLRELQVRWWEDSHLVCGQEVGPTIAEAVRAADYGVCLLSPSYFGSDFIRQFELPHFVDPAGRRGAFPVALRPLPKFDGTRTLHGVENTWVFYYENKPYSRLRARRDEFAQSLAEQIRRRMLGLDGYRAL